MEEARLAGVGCTGGRAIMLLTINKVSDGQWATDEAHRTQSLHNAKLVGSLDEHTVCQLRELSEIVFDKKSFSEGDHFLIDLSDVTDIDHVGLAALVGIIVALGAKAGSLGLILPEDHPVRHALQVTGLDRLFEIHETSDAANKIVLALRRTRVGEEWGAVSPGADEQHRRS